MNHGEENVEELSNELERLCLRQERLESQQRDLSKAIKVNGVLIGTLTYKVNKGRETPPPLQQELESGSGIYEGDRVRVINPNKGQERTGEAFGTTKDGLIKVSTDSGRVIRRLPKNLKRVKQDADGSK
jgi:hypothetical protein